MERRDFMAACWVLGGLVLGVAYVLLAGILAIQTAGARSGAVLNLNNEVIAVAAPSTPLLQWLASAVLGVATLYVVAWYPRRRSPVVRSSLAAAFAMATSSLFVWSLSIEGSAAPGSQTAGTALGWEGWIQEGGTNPAVHLATALAIGAAVLPFASRAES